MSEVTANYDEPWKEAISQYFEPFMQFFYPQINQQIDWSKKPIPLDKELERGLTKVDIINLVRCIDKMMTLPPPLQNKFERKLEDYEKELNMPFLSTIEERAIAKGMEKGQEIGKTIGAKQTCQENIIKILTNRFNELPEKMVNTIRKIDNISILENLLLPSISVNSLAEFQDLIDSFLKKN